MHSSTHAGLRSVSNGLSLHVVYLISETFIFLSPEGERVTRDLGVDVVRLRVPK